MARAGRPTLHTVLTRKRIGSARIRRRPVLLAATTAMSMFMQNAAWAVCADGKTVLPAGGLVVGVAPAPSVASNWSPGIFTAAAGSVFIPDISTHENNAATGALTAGGHNWVFDQGRTLCKETDQGAGNARATGWTMPAINGPDCILLPILKAGAVVSFGDVPFQGDVITPTCNPALLSTATTPNPANTYFNQLGCSISAFNNGGVPVATTQATATSYMFVAGAKSGLFSIPLTNDSATDTDAGKTPGSQNFYSAIPAGQNLTNAAVSKNGQYAIAVSNKKLQTVYACLNPLGDPGPTTKPINPNFFVPSASAVPCMAVGSTNLTVNLTVAFGPDNQLYFGGQHVVAGQTLAVNSFNGTPGGTAAAAWPQCIKQGTTLTIPQAFAAKSSGHCGLAQPNPAISAALGSQTPSLIAHNGYLYAATAAGPVVQFKVTHDAATGHSLYTSRTYAQGFAAATGLGVANDLKSLMVYSDPSGAGVPGQGIITKLPLCEDIP